MNCKHRELRRAKTGGWFCVEPDCDFEISEQPETTARRPEPDDDPASMAGSWRYENAGNPTDGQLMDQLETAFEKMNDGYVCMDMALRKRLAITLNAFMRPAVKSNCESSGQIPKEPQ